MNTTLVLIQIYDLNTMIPNITLLIPLKLA